MKFYVRLSIVFGVFIFLCVPSLALACGVGSNPWWDNMKPKSWFNFSKRLSIDEAIESARVGWGIEVKPHLFIPVCMGPLDIYYDVIDLKTQKYLLTVSVPHNTSDKDHGNVLFERLGLVMKTPRDQLIALHEAEEIFSDDVESLVEDIGVEGFIAPPKSQDLQDVVGLQITEYCDTPNSSRNLHMDRHVSVPIVRYRGDRIHYPIDMIYRRGDLRKAILNDSEILTLIRSSAKNNAQVCTDNRQEKWGEILERLNDSLPDLLQGAIERFQAVHENPTAAYMRNKNRILVIFGSDEKKFTGSIHEMIEIQSALGKKGIVVDKRSRLDDFAQFMLESDIKYNQRLPLSLQE